MKGDINMLASAGAVALASGGGLTSSILPSLISGGLGLYSALSSARASSQSVKGYQKANEQNIALMRERNSLEDYWFRNRYQIQSEDMKKAGLNPILGLGGQPPVPSAQAVQTQNPYQDLATEKLGSAQNLSVLANFVANASKIVADIDNVKVKTAGQVVDNLIKVQNLKQASINSAKAQKDFLLETESDAPAYKRTYGSLGLPMYSVGRLYDLIKSGHYKLKGFSDRFSRKDGQQIGAYYGQKVGKLLKKYGFKSKLKRR